MLILSVTAVLACASVIYGGTSGNSGQVDQTYYSYGVQTDGLFSFLWNDLSNDNSAVALENPVYKLAYLVTLPYSFPFYGHQVLNVSVVSSGFLFVGPVLHQYLTANQYIAPLMADFNPTLSANSEIKYVKSEHRFAVRWKSLLLNNQPDAGSFSFQTTWFTNGSIAFLYETIPMNFTDIQTTNHPVKVGLSNAYNIINDNRMTTYEYNLVDLTDTLIQDRTVIVLHPKPTCIRYYNCEACLSANISFTCKWCPAVGRCSDEVDWYRQEWLDAGCESKAVSECSTTITEPTGIPSQSDNTNDTYHEDHVANTVTFSTPPTVVMATPGENNHDSHSHDHGDDVGLNATTNAPVTAVISQDHSGTPRPGASTEGQVTMSIPNVNYIATGDQLDFQIEEIGFRSVTISWLYPLDNVIPMDFVVQMRTAVTSWYNHTQTDVYILDYRYMAKIKPLLESTIYYIRMYAVADFGRSDYSTTIAFTTKGPSSSSEMLTSGAFPVIFSVLFVQIVLLLQRDDMEPI